MKPIHTFTCGASEFQVTAKNERSAKRELADYIKDEAPTTTVKDWRYQGSYGQNGGE